MSINLYVGNANTVAILGLKNGLSGEFINDADANLTIKNMQGSDVGGAPWPIALNYVGDSDGEYRALLPDTLEISAGDYYQLIINAEGDGLKAVWSPYIQATNRSY